MHCHDKWLGGGCSGRCLRGGSRFELLFLLQVFKSRPTLEELAVWIQKFGLLPKAEAMSEVEKVKKNRVFTCGDLSGELLQHTHMF